MQLQKAIGDIFAQLNGSLGQLTDAQYVYKSPTLSNATIGQHIRHIIEMFTCLQDGYYQGIVNYEKRKRDIRIETDRDFALHLLQKIYEGVNRQNKPLRLQAAYSEDSDDLLYFDTNYYREIAYNLEHTIHHMALIKVGVREVTGRELPENFGVASSTIKYRKECAQ